MATKRLEDYLAKLPAERREAIERRAQELIAEEHSLRELRRARERSRQDIADRLGINQAAVSKMERRTDMYVSTLRGFVEAMGVELEVIARFPDRPPIRINQFNSL
jgi:hypothetical protein